MRLSPDTRRALTYRLVELNVDPEGIRSLDRVIGLPPEQLPPGLAADALWDAVLDPLELQTLEVRLAFLAELQTLAPVLASEPLLTHLETEWRQESAPPTLPPGGSSAQTSDLDQHLEHARREQTDAQAKLEGLEHFQKEVGRALVQSQARRVELGRALAQSNAREVALERRQKELEVTLRGLQSEPTGQREAHAAALAELQATKQALEALRTQAAGLVAGLAQAREERRRLDAKNQTLKAALERETTQPTGLAARAQEAEQALQAAEIRRRELEGQLRFWKRLSGELATLLLVGGLFLWLRSNPESGQVRSVAQRVTPIAVPAPTPRPPATPTHAPIAKATHAPKKNPKPTFLKVPGTGSHGFWMGAKDEVGYDSERPRHKVVIQPFKLSKTEVTVEQYNACVDAGKCNEPNTGDDCNWAVAGREQHPINCVDWNQARAYGAWLSTVIGGTVRLPSEAEWEYAASGKKGRKYPWGNSDPTDTLVAFNSRHGLTSEVSQYPAGASWVGALDMAGNVWEWVEDCWHDSYTNAPKDGSVWMTPCPDTSHRVIRGGDGYNVAVRLRGAYRNWRGAGSMKSNLGFRVAWLPPAGHVSH